MSSTAIGVVASEQLPKSPYRTKSHPVGGNGCLNSTEAQPKKLRMVFLASCVRGGGPGWSLYYLIKHLDRNRIEPILVVPAQGIFEERYRKLGVEVIVPDRFPETPLTQQRFQTDNVVTRTASMARSIFDLIRLVPWLARMFNERGVDVVYCNDEAVVGVGAIASQMAGVGSVIHARALDDPTHPLNFLWKLFGWPFVRNITRLPAVSSVIANSAAAAEPYKGRLLSKVRVVHNGIDLTEYTASEVSHGLLRTELGLDSEATIIGYTGHIKPRKGVEPLIRASAPILKSRSNVYLVIVGRVQYGAPVDYLKEYQKLAIELGVEDRIIFAGFRTDVRPAVVDFDIHCLPSFQEAFGRPITEAMALGRPVVASRVGGIPEIITDGVDGVLVPPGDVEALTAALLDLVNDPDKRARLGKAARISVQERFDVAKLTLEMESLLIAAAD